MPDLGRRALDAGLLARLLTPGIAGVEVVDEVDSTSSRLAAAATSGDVPDVSVLIADHQSAGRGRMQRSWTAPPGTAMLASVWLRPAGLDVERWPTLTLLAGRAIATTVRGLGLDAALKWPNDVVVRDDRLDEVDGWGQARKVAGVLAEVVSPPGCPPRGVVVGMGLNISQTADELPVPWAGSLVGLGAEVGGREAPIAGVLNRFVDFYRRWCEAGGTAPDGSGVPFHGLGSQVCVTLPGGGVVKGTLTGVDGDGTARLTTSDGTTLAVRGGDVELVRAPAGTNQRG